VCSGKLITCRSLSFRGKLALPTWASRSMNPIELETIGLCIGVEAIDDIANHSILDIYEHPNFEAEIQFIQEA
jgi:hypothetical protein